MEKREVDLQDAKTKFIVKLRGCRGKRSQTLIEFPWNGIAVTTSSPQTSTTSGMIYILCSMGKKNRD